MSQATLISPSTFSESYSGSSTKSAGSAPKERYEDLTKDNVASPIDLECHIQSERITKLLDDLIYKSKISVALPRLVEDKDFLSSVLDPCDLEDVMFIFEHHNQDHPLFSNSMTDLGAVEDIKTGDISLKNRLNPELGHLIYILNGCTPIKQRAEQIVNEMRSEYVFRKGNPPNSPLEFLLIMEHFRSLMYAQMEGTAADDLTIKIKMRKMEGENINLIKNINECTTTIKVEHEEFLKNIELKNQLIEKLQQEVAFYRMETASKRKKIILDTDRQMVLMSRAHHTHYQMLQEEQVDVTDSYETTLNRHMQEEKTQRLRRCKVETQLQSWLQKYDIDMGEKQIEMDEYEHLYDEETQLVEDLEIKLVEQDKEYVPLMEEREKEYHQEMSNKLEEFLLEHAARVIQCMWRDVLQNRAEKKKLKKLLAKKIAADEAAAAAAAKAAAAAAKQAAAEAKAEKKAAKEAAKEAAREAKRLAAEEAAKKDK